MGAIVTKKQSNMSWTITWKAAGRYPIVADRIYATLADAQAYVDDTSATASAVPGLVISVVNDPIEKNNGIYYVSKIANTEDAEKSGFPISAKGELVKAGSGAGSMTSANFEVVDGKVTTATADNIGQIIYITGGTEDYPAGPYIVTGVGTVSRLGTTSATGNIAGDVETLKTDVNNLKAKDTELAGSIAGVSDIANANKTAVEKLNGVVFDQDGVLVLAKSSDVYTKGEIDGTLADYVKVADYNAFVESTASNFQSINNTLDGLDDTYATITSVDGVKTSVQTLSGTVDTKAAQSDLEAATGRIDTLETAVNTTIPATYATIDALNGLQDQVNALPEYTITKAESAEEGYAAAYKLMAGKTQVGATINIPKDMVVESGVVRKLTEDEVTAGKGDDDVDYIVLTLSNATDDKLYIKASSLVDIYTPGTYVTITEDKVVSIDVDSVYTTIETTMLSKGTFATPAEVEAAQSAAEQDALNKANAARDAAIADTTTKLTNYTTTADLVNNYATKENLAAEKEALTKSIADNVSDIDARLDLVESQLGLGGGDGEDLSLVEQVVYDVAALKTAVGTTASTDDEGNPVAATGLQLDVDNLKAKDIELSGQISTLNDTAVKTISLNGSDLTPVSGTITINVANEIKAEGNTDTSLISLGAAKNYVDSKVSTINLSLETLETEKASIKLVASDSDATATNVIYLVGDAKAPKVVIDGALHTIGSNLYAAIDKYATTEDGGLMAAADKSKLDEIGAIDIADIEAKINEINASI